jgi:HEPN domain-containing protein
VARSLLNGGMDMKATHFIYALTVFFVGMALLAALRLKMRKQNKSTSENKDALFQEYFGAAIQYHVSARFAAIAGFLPLSGNLAHHAVEMYLKGYLCRKLTEKERRKLGHSLHKIWRSVKQDIGDSTLDQFDATISAIDKFERIRYPEEIVRKGMTATIGFKKGGTVTGPGGQKPSFELVIDDLDALAKRILEHSNVNPKFFTNGLSNDARTYLTQSSDFSSSQRPSL